VSNLAILEGRRIVLISHYLARTGGPLLLLEMAAEMQRAGASVALASLDLDSAGRELANRYNVRVVPVTESFAQAAVADLVVANTAVVKEWVAHYLDTYPEAGRRTVWWIHEIDARRHGLGMVHLDKMAAVVLDSDASLASWRASGHTLPALTLVIHPSVADAFLDAANQSAFSLPAGRLRRATGIGSRPRSRDDIRKKLGVSPADCLVSLFGAYAEVKGHDLFVRTVGRLVTATRELRLKALVIGFHSREERAGFLGRLNPGERRAVSRHRARVTVDDLRAFYAASDVFVMNTQGLGENFGRVTTEAMAFRLPVLGTDAGGTREVVVDGVTGLLHPPGNEGQDMLARNIRRLIGNRAEARALGEAGRKRAETRFGDVRFYREWSQVLEKVLD